MNNFFTENLGFIVLVGVIVVGAVAFIVFGARYALNRNATPQPTKGMGDEPWPTTPEHQGDWGSEKMRGLESPKKPIGRWLLSALAAFALCAGLAYCAKARAAERFTVGLHLATEHFGGRGLQQHNPGIYARLNTGPLQCLTAGIYRNSYDSTSSYLGCTLETTNRWFAITVAAVTGYPAARVMPLLSPSVRAPLWRDAAARLAYIPKPARGGTASGLHLSVEAEF